VYARDAIQGETFPRAEIARGQQEIRIYSAAIAGAMKEVVRQRSASRNSL
jgi:hypothetical protein